VNMVLLQQLKVFYEYLVSMCADIAVHIEANVGDLSPMLMYDKWMEGVQKGMYHGGMPHIEYVLLTLVFYVLHSTYKNYGPGRFVRAVAGGQNKYAAAYVLFGGGIMLTSIIYWGMYSLQSEGLSGSFIELVILNEQLYYPFSLLFEKYGG